MKKTLFLTLLNFMLINNLQANANGSEVGSRTIIRYEFTDIMDRCISDNLNSVGVFSGSGSSDNFSTRCLDNNPYWPSDFNNLAGGFKTIIRQNTNCSSRIIPNNSNPMIKNFSDNFYYKLPEKINGTIIELANFNSNYGHNIARFSCSGGNWQQISNNDDAIINQNQFCDSYSFYRKLSDITQVLNPDEIINSNDYQQILFPKTQKGQIASFKFTANGLLYTFSSTCLSPENKDKLSQWDFNQISNPQTMVMCSNINQLNDLVWSNTITKSYNGKDYKRTFNCKRNDLGTPDLSNYPYVILRKNIEAPLLIGYYNDIEEASLKNNFTFGEATYVCNSGKWQLVNSNCSNLNEDNLFLNAADVKKRTTRDLNGNIVVVEEKFAIFREN